MHEKHCLSRPFLAILHDVYINLELVYSHKHVITGQQFSEIVYTQVDGKKVDLYTILNFLVLLAKGKFETLCDILGC